MVADVVGYSRMMEADEAGTLAALKERRKAVLEPVVKAHGGRIVKVIGVSGVQVIAKIAGILLAALAVQLMLLALQDLGVLERQNRRLERSSTHPKRRAWAAQRPKSHRKLLIVLNL